MDPLTEFSASFTRRQSLKLLAGVAVIGVLGISGCGGVGGERGGSPLVLTSGRVSVTLPTGFTIPLAELSGETAFGASGLESDGGFTAKFGRDAGPTFTWLRHTKMDKFVLFGFAGEGQNGIGAKATAVAMVAMGIGIGGLAPSDGRAVVSLLEADPAVATLAGVIETRVAVNPYAVVEGDAEIKAAVAACVAALNPRAMSRARTASRSPQEITRAEPDPIMTITPGDQSGSNVIQKEEPASLYFVNNYRRPATYLTYKTGYATDAGDTMLDAAKMVGKKVELPPVGTILGQIFTLNQNPAYAPVESVRFGLDIGSSEKKAYYQTVCLMASGKSEEDGEPAFFALPRYAGEVAAWREMRATMNQHAWLGGVMCDTFAAVVGGAASWISATTAASVIAQVQAAGATAAQATILAASGQAIRGTETCVRSAAEAGDIGFKTSGAIATLIVQARAAGVVSVTTQIVNAVRALAAMIAEAIVISGAVAALIDIGYTYKEFVGSEKAAAWDITLAKSQVALGVDKATMKAGETATFNVSIVGGRESEYRYKWKVRGGNGVLGEVGSPNAGLDIETTTTTVSLLSAPSDVDKTTYVVTVEAIAKSNGASLGTATKSVKIEGQTNTVAGVRKTFTKAQKSDFDPNLYVFDALVTVEFTPTPGSKYFILRGEGTPIDHDPTGTIGKGFDSPDTVTEKTKTLLRNTLVAESFTGVVGENQWLSAFDEQTNKMLDWKWSVECYPERPA